jgi:hypothetical protein
MPRWVGVVGLCVVVVALASTVDAQRRFPVRGRPSTDGGIEIPPNNESVSITSPSPPGVTTTSTSQTLVGTATSGIVSVSWANAATGGSGSASLTGGVWRVEVPGSALVFEDTFTDARVPLTSHVPDTGTSWTSVANTTTSSYIEVYGSADEVRGVTTSASDTRILLEAVSSGPSGTRYAVSLGTASSFATNSSTGGGLLFGITDASNYCVVDLISGSVIAAKVVADVPTTLATITGTPAALQTYTASRDGDDFTIQRNGVVVASFTDAACAGSNRVGLGMGAIRPGSGKAVQASERFDDFVLSDPSAAATGIALNTGANTITVTGLEADSTPHTAVIVVTRAGTDTTSPTIGISSPSPRPYATTSGSLAVSGIADDNVGVSSVTVACATCTPTLVSATLSNAGPTSVSWTASLTLATGANSITVTATDAAANSTVSAFTATLSAGADTTPPSIAISIPNSSGSSTTTTSPVILGDSNNTSDNVQLTSVTWSGDTCGGGTATGLTSWTASISFTVPTTCVVTVTATDSSGNTATDTHTFTYAPPLSITTVSPLQPAPEDSAYAGATLAATGGTAPYTWDINGGGSSLGAGACTGGSISSAGVITGTFTTAGTCTFTARVTDNVAATATKSFSIVVGAVSLGGTNHSYFNTMCARADMVVCETLRDAAKVTTGVPGNYVSRGGGINRWVYDPSNDAFASPQDGTKYQIIAFDDPTPLTLTGAIDASTTSVCIAGVDKKSGFAVKIDNEILVFNGTQPSTCPFVMSRGAYGTTAASHVDGAIVYEHRGTLSSGRWLEIPTPTSTGNSYFYAFDVYTSNPATEWADKFKWMQFTSAGGTLNYEPNLTGALANGSVSTGCGTVPNVTFDDTVDAGIITPPRHYSMPVYPITKSDGPTGSCPGNNSFVVKVGVWTRLFVQITFKPESTVDHDAGWTLSADLSTSTSTALIPVRQGGVDVLVEYPNTSTITVNGSFIVKAGQMSFRRVTNDGRTAVGTRRIKIGSEIMTVLEESSYTSGTARTVVVQRGTDGSTIASHTSGDPVLVSADRVSLWVADETRDPVAIQLDMPHYFGGRRSASMGFEFNTSTDRIPEERAAAGNPNLIGYVRDFILLGKSGSPDAGWEALRTKPTVGGN